MQRLAKLPHPNHLFFVATTQEEIGLRGARTAANMVHPDLGFAIEGGIANDQGGHPEETQAHLGAGPGICFFFCRCRCSFFAVIFDPVRGRTPVLVVAFAVAVAVAFAFLSVILAGNLLLLFDSKSA